MAKKKNEISIRSSAAEYLTYVASVGEQEDSIEMHYEDENIWLTQKMMAGPMSRFSTHFNLPEVPPPYVFFHTPARIHPVTCSRNDCEFVSCCKKLPDIRKSTGMLACDRGF